MTSRHTHIVACAIALLWGAAWTAFGLASGIGEKLDAIGIFMHTLLPGGVCLAIACIACWRSRIGAWLLLAAGAVLAVGYPILAHPQFTWTIIAVMEATLAMPPLVAAWLIFRGLGASRRAP